MKPTKYPASKEEIRAFIRRHGKTTYDQYSDYPDPIEHIIWEGTEYISRDMRYLVEEIYEHELQKIPVWFPSRVWVSTMEAEA